MKKHLEHEIRLNDKPDHVWMDGPPWCLEEIDAKDQAISEDLIPWKYGVHFTCRNLRIQHSFDFGELTIDEDDDEEKEKPKFETYEQITAELFPGVYVDEHLAAFTHFYMLGTGRPITKFKLYISEMEDEENERCRISGGIDNSGSDWIEIFVGISIPKYRKLIDLISNRRIDKASVSLARVSGFYSRGGIESQTSHIKVLCDRDEQKIIMPEGCKIKPPTLRTVGKIDLDLSTINKLEDYELNEDEQVVDKDQERKDHNIELLELITRNQVTIGENQGQDNRELQKLKIPMWCIVALLGFLSVVAIL